MSSSSSSSLSFQPICSNGSKFFACTTGTKFIGCCTTTLNPCNPSSGCGPSNLKAASFSAEAYGTFPDQECPAGSLWYTCKETRPPFWGCCRVNACAERGCVGGVGGNLSGAFLSSNSSVAAAFLSMVGSSHSTSTSTSALAATTSLIAGTSATATTTTNTTAPKTTTSSSTPKKTTNSTSAIIGGTVAGIAVVSAFLLVLFFLHRRRKAAATTTAAATATAADGGDGGDGGGSGTMMPSIPSQQSPLNTQHMLDNDQNTHPALRKPEISSVAPVEERGFKQSVPNMGKSQFEAYEPQKYHQTSPPPAFPIYNHLNRNAPIRLPPPPPPPTFPIYNFLNRSAPIRLPPPPPPPLPTPPPPPSYIISEIDGTPVSTSSPASPAFNTFPPTAPTRAYSACSELASERDTSAEMKGDLPTQPAGRREMEETTRIRG